MDKKELNTSQVQIRIQPSLFKKFKSVCDKKYKSVSGMLKDLIVRCIEENKDK
jgi:hypothetical protein